MIHSTIAGTRKCVSYRPNRLYGSQSGYTPWQVSVSLLVSPALISSIIRHGRHFPRQRLVADLSFSAMAGILVVLIMIHNKTQREKMARLEAYRKEQLEYRRSILSFHTSLSATTSKAYKSQEKEISSLVAGPISRRTIYRSESVDSRRDVLPTLSYERK